MNREYVLYAGKVYNLEWYYNQSGKSLSLDEYRQNALLKLAKHMGDFGKIMNIEKFRFEGNKIFAFKPRPDGYLCFFAKGGKIIITNAFCKKSQKLPVKEFDLANRLKVDYENRILKGRYYE